MKRYLAIFVMMCIPVFSYAACSGDIFTQDCFYSQNITNLNKTNWGNPTLPITALTETDLTDLGEAVLRDQWRCGTCTIKLGGDGNGHIVWDYVKMADKCGGDARYPNNQSVLAYVATEFSDHGAKFCLYQLTASTDGQPSTHHFVVKHYKNLVTDSSCRWFCYPGWDGTECEKQNPSTVDSRESLKFTGGGYDFYLENFARFFSENYFLTNSAEATPAAGDIKVLDYKTLPQENSLWTEDQIIIMATYFDEYGIRARPVRVSAGGGTNSCSFDTLHSLLSFGIDEGATHLYLDGYSSEYTLCLQGYTRGAQCDSVPLTQPGGGGTCPNLNWCPGWKAENGINFYTKYPQNGGPERFCDVTKYKIVDDTDSDGTVCKRIDCQNGMNFTWQDNYKCSMCEETAQRGLCKTTSKCKWCSVGKCFNRDTCKCDECSSVVTDQDMLYGPTQSDKCWAILDNDEFKACVTGNTSGEN